MSNERSAEWLRGAVESHINTCNLITSITSANKIHPARQGLMAAGNELHNQLDRYRALLAAAEAREAGKRGGVGSAENSSQVIENAITLGGVEASQPTAAEVIEACRVALAGWKTHMGLPTGATGDYGQLRTTLAVAQMDTDAALAEIARWKEANSGKP